MYVHVYVYMFVLIFFLVFYFYSIIRSFHTRHYQLSIQFGDFFIHINKCGRVVGRVCVCLCVGAWKCNKIRKENALNACQRRKEDNPMQWHH